MLKNNTMNVKSNKALIYFIFSIVVGVAIGLIFSEFFLNKKAKLSYKENSLSYSYSEAVIKASPAVVNIYSQQVINQSRDSRRSFNSIFNKKKGNQIKQSLGSGVILSSDGYILTNLHVIGNKALKVTIELYDGRKYIGKLVGIDEGTDLAVIKIKDEENSFPSIEIEDSDSVKIGDIVLAIGNPYGLGQSVSMGIISATGREFDNPYSNYIQTDASINRGNSGGALIDAKGQLIGINTLMQTSSGGSEGIGLAIPSTTALEIVSDLIQYGEVRRGWLGFSIDRQSLIQFGRIVVAETTKNGPAYLGGLKRNDVINTIDSKAATYDNLYKTFARSKPDDEIKMSVTRDNEEIDLIIKTGKLD